MLSIVVVGRNDSHGYNLSKRVATSLNSLTLPMTEGDELIFVDWNSDDINPTFIDAIRDTLTEKTLKHLVVYRVRSSIHKNLAKGTNRPILEPIARNAGIRRAKNNWILSTNTDMIFNTYGKSYRQILKNLQPNLYHLYRYEIPEYIWDQFDRLKPDETLETINSVFKKNNLYLKISTAPYETYENLFPDAVGDFQLAPKEFWHKLQGFPEDMLKGWHVDSRLSVSMENKLELKSQIISSEIFEGYHQDHLRMLTHFHSSKNINSLEIIGEPYSNPSDWGLNNLMLENEVTAKYRLDTEIRPLISKSKSEREIVLQEYLAKTTYKSELTYIFLLDELLNLPTGSNVLVSSMNSDFHAEIDQICKALFGKKADVNFVEYSSASYLNLVVLDFGVPQHLAKKWLRDEFLIEYEKKLNFNVDILQKIPPGTRVAIIRGQHWTIRSLIHEYCSVPLFNNYPSILSGVKKGKSSFFSSKFAEKSRNSIRIKVLLGGIDLTLDENYPKKKSIPELLKLAPFKINSQIENSSKIFIVYKKLPFKIRKYINPRIRKYLNIY